MDATTPALLLVKELLRVWEVLESDKFDAKIEPAVNEGEAMKLVAWHIVTGYSHRYPPGNLNRQNYMPWMPWAYAVIHREDMMEEMGDAAPFADRNPPDEAIYQELQARVNAINPLLFLPDGVLHGRPDDSQDIPTLFILTEPETD